MLHPGKWQVSRAWRQADHCEYSSNSGLTTEWPVSLSELLSFSCVFPSYLENGESNNLAPEAAAEYLKMPRRLLECLWNANTSEKLNTNSEPER